MTADKATPERADLVRLRALRAGCSQTVTLTVDTVDAIINEIDRLRTQLEQEREISNDLGENEARWRDRACIAEAALSTQPAPTDATAVLRKCAEWFRSLQTGQRPPLGPREMAELVERTLTQPAPTDAMSAKEAWQDLIEMDDRNSPEEYPEIALISFDELAAYMKAAQPVTTDAMVARAVDAIRATKEVSRDG